MTADDLPPSQNASMHRCNGLDIELLKNPCEFWLNTFPVCSGQPVEPCPYVLSHGLDISSIIVFIDYSWTARAAKTNVTK